LSPVAGLVIPYFAYLTECDRFQAYLVRQCRNPHNDFPSTGTLDLDRLGRVSKGHTLPIAERAFPAVHKWNGN
jgi:hypothetical protein